ncbi:uncharacterized protein N7498_010314 [Penicillium cinerascens]|uniref:Uncharacterized protein n=1 Tax=Penicillium cinerascens TaxID=70096 RepID=A0A9W9J7P8_9EURO|nr:uncharacterized protein N7498_010314 [Penicillium cinerascens]KAJ5191329.1 hypothetical protein N7498_010314 [Penicillium cinerascens]
MSSRQIHIFGDLFLPDPKDYLPEVELEKVNRLLPLIEKFKSSLNEKLKSSGTETDREDETTTQNTSASTSDSIY